jgi:hypothetical protein
VPYHLLGHPLNATEPEIRYANDSLHTRHHPDKPNEALCAEATTRFRELRIVEPYCIVAQSKYAAVRHESGFHYENDAACPSPDAPANTACHSDEDGPLPYNALAPARKRFGSYCTQMEDLSYRQETTITVTETKHLNTQLRTNLWRMSDREVL